MEFYYWVIFFIGLMVGLGVAVLTFFALSFIRIKDFVSHYKEDNKRFSKELLAYLENKHKNIHSEAIKAEFLD